MGGGYPEFVGFSDENVCNLSGQHPLNLEWPPCLVSVNE